MNFKTLFIISSLLASNAIAMEGNNNNIHNENNEEQINTHPFQRYNNDIEKIKQQGRALNAARKIIGDLQKQIEIKDKLLRKTTRKLEAIEANLRQNKPEYERRNRIRNQEHLNMIRDLDGRNEALENTIRDRDRRNETLENMIRDLRQELEAKNKENTTLLDRHQSISNDLEKRYKELEQKDNELDQKNNEIMELRRGNQSLQTDLTTLQTSNNEMWDENNKLKAEKERNEAIRRDKENSIAPSNGSSFTIEAEPQPYFGFDPLAFG